VSLSGAKREQPRATFGSRQALYRFYNRSDELLYVGITCNIAGRLRQHRDDKDWWAEVSRIELEHFASRSQVLAAERRAIQTEHPKHNVRLNGRAPDAPIQMRGRRGRVLKSLEVGGVYALGLADGECPVGRVIDADDEGVTVTLFSWLLGMFDGPDDWISADLIQRWRRAERLPDGHDGWTKGIVLYDMDPLGSFQTRWHEQSGAYE
jgi:predicted GIY-YIG superfamily endonuclease